MSNLLNQSANLNFSHYRPQLLDMNRAEDAVLIKNLRNDPMVTVLNTIADQLKEFIKIKNPCVPFSKEEIAREIDKHLNNTEINSYGIWVFYPWSHKLIHTLPKEEFIAVRTSRNLYKITPEELAVLRTKKIGIIGLSVGQTIAHTIATERICDELRLADFDTLELSNLNRLNAGIQDLGLPKVFIAARKISEIDPFIKVSCWPEGITETNIDDFLTSGGNLDILVEECDGLDIKILSRLKARSLKIPVVMDTNDRGMLDIERFDLEESRPIFHGKLDETVSISGLSEMTNLEKLPLLDAMVGISTVSDRMKFSLGEMGKTITTWPQLASSVTLGAAMVTDACRRILLGQSNSSGRYYIDFDELIK